MYDYCQHYATAKSCVPKYSAKACHELKSNVRLPEDVRVQNLPSRCEVASHAAQFPRNILCRVDSPTDGDGVATEGSTYPLHVHPVHDVRNHLGRPNIHPRAGKAAGKHAQAEALQRTRRSRPRSTPDPGKALRMMTIGRRQRRRKFVKEERHRSGHPSALAKFGRLHELRWCWAGGKKVTGAPTHFFARVRARLQWRNRRACSRGDSQTGDKPPNRIKQCRPSLPRERPADPICGRQK